MILVQASESVSERQQFQNIIQCLAKYLEKHKQVTKLGQDQLEVHAVSILSFLREKNPSITLEAVKSLPRLQFSVVKQLLSIYDKDFAKMIAGAAPAVSVPVSNQVQEVVLMETSNTNQLAAR